MGRIADAKLLAICFRAYDNGQSPDIFWPNYAYAWPNQIWADKFSIHYQWKFIEFAQENEYPDNFFSPSLCTDV